MLRFARALAFAALVIAPGLMTIPVAHAAPQGSTHVALVPGAEPDGDAGTLQTSGTVDGSPGESFSGFDFTDVSVDSLDPATLSQFDTVVLNEVETDDLSSAAEQALSSFVTGGGKLIIHDADATDGNDYSWLPVPSQTGQSCQDCGNTDGSATVVENSPLVSDSPSSPAYVDLSELPDNSDAVGDANVLITSDPRWDVDMRATNSQNVDGAVGAYATDGGLIIYNGLDTDAIGDLPSGNDWLDKLWHQELTQQWNPDNLPHSAPAVGGGGGGLANCGSRP